MLRYAIRRAGHGVLVLWAAFTATFFLLYVLPGDRALAKLGGDAGGTGFNAEQLARLRAQLGLDDPVLVQYGRALWRAIQGDFGVSVQTGGDALRMFATGVPETLKLAAAALFLGLAIGATVALASTLTAQPFLKRVLQSVPVFGVSVPPFWVGLMLLQFISFRWQLLPAMGYDGLASLVLPALTLSIPTAAVVAQILSRSLEGALRGAYIDTARSRGAGRARLVFGHALRNGVLPMLTALGMTTGHLIAGSVVIETVFSRSGIGLITVKAVTFQDTPLVLVAVVFAAGVFVVVNFLVDILYPIIDPRIDLGRRPAEAAA